MGLCISHPVCVLGFFPGFDLTQIPPGLDSTDLAAVFWTRQVDSLIQQNNDLARQIVPWVLDNMPVRFSRSNRRFFRVFRGFVEAESAFGWLRIVRTKFE